MDIEKNKKLTAEITIRFFGLMQGKYGENWISELNTNNGHIVWREVLSEFDKKY